jgi:phage replication-related protein YjqB (UPF0714/DUF867 family)
VPGRDAMSDRYDSFSALSKLEVRDVDYRIRRCDRRSAVAILAPHGGGIEPGTSEIAEAIAGREHSFYAFEGIKAMGNRELHLTSTRFDEPGCVALVAASATAIAIHGSDGEGPMVHIGGRDDDGRERIANFLMARHFRIETHSPTGLLGLDPANICNRTLRQAGIQLELSLGLRRCMFQSLSRSGRRVASGRFAEFVSAVRDALA